jgi:hypothetical protein
MPNFDAPIRLDPRQVRVINGFANSNGLTAEQATSALLAAGAKSFANDTNIQFSSTEAQQMQMLAHQMMQSTQAMSNSMTSVGSSQQAIVRNIR